MYIYMYIRCSIVHVRRYSNYYAIPNGLFFMYTRVLAISHSSYSNL